MRDLSTISRDNAGQFGFVGRAIMLEELKNNPHAVIVKRLTEHGNVETLTHLKLKLFRQGRLCKNFSKGEPFSGRKPKGKSSLQTLEERLSVDICELTGFIDSVIVTLELKNMFKPVSADEHNITSNETDCETGKSNTEMDKGCETPIPVASQGGLPDSGLRLSHEFCRESFVKLEVTLHRVRETFNEDIALLNELVQEQGKLLEKQDKKISLLIKNNNLLKDELQTFRDANVFNQNMNKLNTNTSNLSIRESPEIDSVETAAGETRSHVIIDSGPSGIETLSSMHT